MLLTGQAPCIVISVNSTPDDIRRLGELDRFFSQLDLPHDIIDVVSALNPGGDNPYHGTQHLFTVAIRCAEAGNLYDLTQRERRELVLAGLFHDYGHPLYADDRANIEVAVKGWNRIGVPYSTDVDNTEVERLIRASVFPHSEPKDIREAIIQDADLMQSLEPDRERFYEGLSAESGRETDDATTSDFLSSQEIHTEWAKELLAIRVANEGR